MCEEVLAGESDLLFCLVADKWASMAHMGLDGSCAAYAAAAAVARLQQRWLQLNSLLSKKRSAP